ncbi:MAG: hybrid sensor histidine kinase/response regulator [Bryobacterales bacterium]|nr:hybrid sensor histidine kinase/response regulator [Bryobacterales bacterium]
MNGRPRWEALIAMTNAECLPDAIANAGTGHFSNVTPHPAREKPPSDSRRKHGQSPPGSQPESARLAVLAVDAAGGNLAQIQELLARMSVELIAAQSDEEALALVGKGRIALVLVDLSTPALHGLETARRIRERFGEAAPPVLFVTAQDAADEFIPEMHEADHIDFLRLPVDPGLLRTKVEALRLSRASHAPSRRRATGTIVPEGEDAHRSPANGGALRDVGFELVELQHRNRELARRNQELGSFAHVISHDLRQPLQSILDYLELMAATEACAGNPDVSRWLKSSRKLGQNMQALISGVLDFATIGAHSMSFRMVDGNAVLQNAIENLLAVIRRENALVSYDPLPKILGSEAFLSRLFQNLIGNAIKYRREKQPCIRIACERRQRHGGWLIRVIDNGRGIPAGQLPTIFDMFARAENSRAVAGSGIGLAISKKIVELHGGKIWVESKLGIGSEFHIVFPNFDDRPK